MRGPIDRPGRRRAQFNGQFAAPDPASLAATVRQTNDAWRQFMEFVDSKTTTRWVFRGCGSRSYKFIPTVGRSDAYSVESEISLFRSFQRSANQFATPRPANEWEWLAMAQHHGLPTRLLDWTTNPLVACFFAVSGTQDEDAVVYALKLTDDVIVDPETQRFPFARSGVGFVVPTQTIRRIVSQRGLFSVHDDPANAWDPRELKTFLIPKAVRAKFRRSLFKLGIDDAHIGGDLDGICKMLKWRYDARIGIGATMIG